VKNDRAHNRWLQTLRGCSIPDQQWKTDSDVSSRTRCCHSQLLLSGILERSQNKIPAFAGMTGIQKRIWSPPLGKPPTGFSELDIGEPPGVECDVGRTLDELVSSELETTRVTDGSECCQEFPPDRNKSGIRVRTEVLTPQEVHDGCCLTMDSRRFQLCQN
jgi:hypothetical protein